MAKRLIVTVGMSLFSSASWNNAGPFADISGYSEWLSLDGPAARKSFHMGAYIEQQITDLLLGDPESGALVAQFAPGFSRANRYSAEISTLISMKHKLNRFVSFGDFLGSYGPVVLVHGGGDGNPSAAAARHVAAALNTHASLRNAELKSLDGGGDIRYELKNLVEYLQNLNHDETDLVATGGYKAYAVALGHVYWQRLDKGWRLFYLHEHKSDMGELVQEWAGTEGPRTDVDGISIRWESPHLE